MHIDYVDGKESNIAWAVEESRGRLKLKTQKEVRRAAVIHALTIQAVARRGLPYGSKKQRRGYERRCRREVMKIYHSEYKILGGGIGEMIIAAFITTAASMLFRYLIPRIIDWLENELGSLKEGDQSSELDSIAMIARGIDL